ncbi:MAG: DEAD/DEAH box helicase [Verrucomicrobia bacterium]|nr:DEAD/DEAH box helicase [Verrucomicrobiota bacterium]
MLVDALDVNVRLRPDVVVLDEAQRIKNWSTKTSQAIKRLLSRYAFVLTGTPIENRIDELHSLMDFLNPSVLGPLFRFNREFYLLDDRGRPEGYRNLDQLNARIRPYMLRRRKDEVETELPDRTDRTHFVKLSDTQVAAYEDHSMVVARLAFTAKRRPLTKQEQEKLFRHLAMMRMVCDTNYILDPKDRACPKLAELEKILDECRENNAKVIVFSEWERMLQLVRELCEKNNLGFAWHTGSVPQKRRRAEINAFKTDPNCLVFLSTDSGSTGLNLQVASVVINCDLPWNPAKLEQRIARAWRKHQTKPVTVINLVSKDTIEQRMLETLANKQALADGVLDSRGDLSEIKLRTGSQAFLAKLEQLVAPVGDGNKKPVPSKKMLPADRALGFGKEAKAKLGNALVRCEERFPKDGAHSVLMVIVDRDAPLWRDKLSDLHQEYFGPQNSDPLAPVQLEVIDQSTHDALERMIAAGLVARTTRASRPLDSDGGGISETSPLSDEERRRADQYRAQGARKLKMARLLGEGGMIDETRASLLESIPQFGCALAVENRVPEPRDLKEALLPPLSHFWKEGIETVKSFVNDASAPWKLVADHLGKV